MNKNFKKQSNSTHSFNPQAYLVAMKEFQHLTRGIRKGSTEYEEIRSDMYQRLKNDDMEFKSKKLREAKGMHTRALNSDAVLNFDDFYTMLIAVPEEVESHECVNILNYFEYPFNLEEDELLHPIIKTEMGFEKTDPYPALCIDSSHPEVPSVDLAGNHQILTILRQQGFINDHSSHSANEKQTLEFIQSHVSPLLHILMLPFKNKLQFYSVPRHFKQAEVKKEVGDFAVKYFWKVRKLVRFHRTDKKHEYCEENEELVKMS